MRPWVLPRVILGLLLVLSPRAASAEGLMTDIAAGKKLLAEGDAQADKGETTEAVILYKRAFEMLLPGMRKLPFKHEVKRDVTAREDLRALLVKEIDEEMSPAEFHANELGMKALGLLPRDINLKETMVKIYAEEIAAFYDTKTKTMHLIREPEAEKPRSFLERLMGKKGGFDKDENKTVIAHELTHALADQNFDIDAMQEAIKREHDDDRDLALSALIEGEATLTMIGAQMNDWDGSIIKDVPSANLDRVFSLIIPFLPLAGGASLREAPVILSETMIFPYLRGLIFCARLTNDGGWSALSDAYREPPLSTEQIIHPEKYRAKLDRPMRIDLGTLETGCGWHEVGRNVVGEMQLGVMLRRHGGKVAAAGWDGDRYAVFEGSNSRLGLVWLTTWDSEADAREFAQGYARFRATKRETDQPPLEERAEASRQGAVFALERRGADVAVVEGFPPDTTDRLLEAAFRATKAEMTYTPPETGRKTRDR